MNYEEEYNRLLMNEYRILKSPSGTEFIAQRKKRKRRFLSSFFYYLLFDVIMPEKLKYKWVNIYVVCATEEGAKHGIDEDIKKRLDRDMRDWVEIEIED